MLRPVKRICTLGILPLAIVLWNCTTDGEKITVGEDELSDVQVVDDSIFDEPEDDEEEEEEEEEAESSSSSKAEKKGKSSSSKKASAKSSSGKSTDSETDDEDMSSSSTAKSSSSARKIRVPGVEDSEKSSSSKAKSSNSKAKSSSSDSEDEEDTPSLTDVDSAAFEAMDKFDSSMQEDINKLINMKDSFIRKSKSTEIDLSTFDFDQNEYLCKAHDGSFYSITEKTIKSISKAKFGVAVYPITTSVTYDFGNICDAIYMGAVATD